MTKDEKEEQERRRKERAAAAVSVGHSVNQNVGRMHEKYYKPEYRGNRKIYDDGSAKRQAKEIAFKNHVKVRDPYTGQELVLTVKEAKARFGPKWQDHLAESDHIHPLARVIEEMMDCDFLTVSDAKKIANSQDNMKVWDRTGNNAKGKKTNEEAVNNKVFQEKTDGKLPKSGQQKMIQDGKAAQEKIAEKKTQKSARNVASEIHQAGMDAAMNGAVTAGAMSACTNIVAVLEGKKSAEDAVIDVGKDTAVSAAQSYLMSGPGSVVGYKIEKIFSRTDSPFLKGLAGKGVPGEVIGMVMATGGTLKAWASGDISTEECILQLGKTGLSTTISGATAALGQCLIPIPVVGFLVGSFVGSVISDGISDLLLAGAGAEERARADAARARAEADIFIRNSRRQRAEFERLVHQFLAEREKAILDGLAGIERGCAAGDFDTATAGMNRIAKSFHKEVPFRNKREFDDFQNDPDAILKL